MFAERFHHNRARPYNSTRPYPQYNVGASSPALRTDSFASRGNAKYALPAMEPKITMHLEKASTVPPLGLADLLTALGAGEAGFSGVLRSVQSNDALVTV
jgi:hypothetical protein